MSIKSNQSNVNSTNKNIFQKTKDACLLAFLVASLIVNAGCQMNVQDKYADYLTDNYDGITLRVKDKNPEAMEELKDMLKWTKEGHLFEGKLDEKKNNKKYTENDYNRKEFGQYIVNVLKESKTPINVEKIESSGVYDLYRKDITLSSDTIPYDFLWSSVTPQETIVHETTHLVQDKNGLFDALNCLSQKDYIIASCLYEIDAYTQMGMYKDFHEIDCYNRKFALQALYFISNYRLKFEREGIGYLKSFFDESEKHASNAPTKGLEDIAEILNKSPFFQYDYDVKFCDDEILGNPCNHTSGIEDTFHRNIYDFIWGMLPDEITYEVTNKSAGNLKNKPRSAIQREYNDDLTVMAGLQNQKQR